LLDGLLDVAEVDQHAPGVEMVPRQGDDRATVVAVKVAALSIVVQEPMAVAKVDLAGDSKHSRRATPQKKEGLKSDSQSGRAGRRRQSPSYARRTCCTRRNAGHPPD